MTQRLTYYVKHCFKRGLGPRTVKRKITLSVVFPSPRKVRGLEGIREAAYFVTRRVTMERRSWNRCDKGGAKMKANDFGIIIQ